MRRAGHWHGRKSSAHTARPAITDLALARILPPKSRLHLARLPPLNASLLDICRRGTRLFRSCADAASAGGALSAAAIMHPRAYAQGAQAVASNRALICKQTGRGQWLESTPRALLPRRTTPFNREVHVLLFLAFHETVTPYVALDPTTFFHRVFAIAK